MNRNLLLISVDCLRWDAVGADQYGEQRGRTGPFGAFLGRRPCMPCLEALVRRGILVSNVFTSAPFTPPAHASLLTGLYPMRHGVRLLIGQRMRTGVPTLASVLREAGYQTAAFPGVFVLNSDTGILRGADHVADVTEGVWLKRGGHWRPGRQSVKLLAEFLRRRDPHRPFFAFVHVFDAHETLRKLQPGVPLRKAYRRRLRRTDRVFFRPLLRLLRRMSLEQSTCIVVTADHGEGLGETERSHGRTLFDATLRVPLLYVVPWLGARFKGMVVDGGISRLVDVMPTVLGLLGLRAPRTDGVDLSRALLGEEAFPRLDAYSETSPVQLYEGDRRAVKPFQGVELATLRTDEWRLVESAAGERHLYRTGPQGEERQDVAAEHAAVAESMSRRLRELGAWDVPQEGTGEAAPVDEKTVERLRDLGYA